MSRTEVAGLLDRVREAKGPVTDDAEIERLVEMSPWYDSVPSHDMFWNNFVRALRGSVDAALVVVEHALPGWHWLIRNGHASGCFASAHPADSKPHEGGPIFYGKAPTASLAMLAALLTAITGGDDGK